MLPSTFLSVLQGGETQEGHGDLAELATHNLQFGEVDTAGNERAKYWNGGIIKRKSTHHLHKG